MIGYLGVLRLSVDRSGSQILYWVGSTCALTSYLPERYIRRISYLPERYTIVTSIVTSDQACMKSCYYP